MKAFQIVFALQLLVSTRLFAAGLPSGQVVWWGDNMGGYTKGVYSPGYSTGTVTFANGPLSSAETISAGIFHSLAVKNDGTVVGWGGNQAGMATGTEGREPYRCNGLVAIGNRALTNVVSIAAGGSFSLVLKSNGTVVAWGNDYKGITHIPVGLNKGVAPYY